MFKFMCHSSNSHAVVCADVVNCDCDATVLCCFVTVPPMCCHTVVLCVIDQAVVDVLSRLTQDFPDGTETVEG